MALKPCRECKKEVSTEAKSCPSCGVARPVKNNHTKLFLLSLGLLLLMGLCTSIGGNSNDGAPVADVVGAPVAHAADQAEPQVEQVAAPEVVKQEPTEEPALPAPKVPPLKVTALKLWKDYDANEVSADSLYKDKPLLVTGKVSSIDKDFMGDIVLKLAAASRWEDVHAELADSEASTAAKLSKGATVTLTCEGAGKGIGSPLLNECTFN